MPVYGTIASQFNDKGTNALFAALVQIINQKVGSDWETSYEQFAKTQKQDVIIPNDRRYYLRELTDTVRGYHKKNRAAGSICSSSIPIRGGLSLLLRKKHRMMHLSHRLIL
ncbi:hypothetical protein OL548_08790 [Lysinibacillus sp. MHQ-1]|nr:hypothetical protein OL548_08790 [Lysinibacillus sp. MHQ-1]